MNDEDEYFGDDEDEYLEDDEDEDEIIEDIGMDVVTELNRDDLQERLSRLSGLSFIIIIGQENGTFRLVPRERNPCMGGHLRKYGVSHNDCTRPQDRKPSDLPYPFPNGKPVGLVYGLRILASYKKVFEATWSDESPWIKGFGGSENIEFLPHKHYNKYNDDKIVYDGIWIKSGDFDPTVLVNLLKNELLGKNAYERCLKEGLSVTDALTFKSFFELQNDQCTLLQNTYFFDPFNSVRRMVEKNPVDISSGIYDENGILLSRGSGLWGDRFDYNRPDMACVFRPSAGNEEDKKEKYIAVPRRYSERCRELKIKSLPFKECLKIFNEAKVFEGEA